MLIVQPEASRVGGQQHSAQPCSLGPPPALAEASPDAAKVPGRRSRPRASHPLSALDWADTLPAAPCVLACLPHGATRRAARRRPARPLLREVLARHGRTLLHLSGMSLQRPASGGPRRAPDHEVLHGLDQAALDVAGGRRLHGRVDQALAPAHGVEEQLLRGPAPPPDPV